VEIACCGDFGYYFHDYFPIMYIRIGIGSVLI
jgi:hypothetical protein